MLVSSGGEVWGARILLAPVLKKGLGSGHLMRCLALARELPGETRILRLESDADESAELVEMIAEQQAALLSEMPPADGWDFVIVDRRATSRSERSKLCSLGCLVGLDEGGKDRGVFPYLIDILPGKRPRHKPNVSSLSYLDLPGAAAARDRGARSLADRGGEDRIPDKDRIRRVMITFGGEDPAHLSQALLRLLDRTGILGGCEITAVEGPAFGRRSWSFDGHCAALNLVRSSELRDPDGLKNRLGRYDLVFTSFGLTCFEALASGTPVILLNPTRYHRKLSRHAGLPEIGVKKPSLSKLSALLRTPGDLLSTVSTYRAELGGSGESLAQHVASLRPPASAVCPSCGSVGQPAVGRFRFRSYMRCRRCGLIFLLDFSGRRAEYGQCYFDEEYERQYGRTYLEDFEQIKRFALRRLRVARRFIGEPGGKSLLDVGCAYGPFLQAAREQGYSCSGIDVASEAVSYVRDELGIPCRESSFEEYAGPKVDVVTMWYVIEHLGRLHDVMEKIRSLLSPGGFFLFSTPNVRGVSGRRDVTAYLESSPLDHLTVWSPRAARRILKDHGFAVRAVRITGHHPERFPFFLAVSRRVAGWRGLEQGSMFRRALGVISRLFRLGDTFEVYAEKIK